MLKAVIFFLLLLVFIVLIIRLLVKGLTYVARKLKHKETSYTRSQIIRELLLPLASFLLCLFFIWITQVSSSTPAIRDDKGKVVPGSIAELRKVELNGRKQWISIRGYDRKKPLLLFLAGGPGGSQMAAVRHDLAELEKHFVVVNWDQPGSAKSYGAIAIDEITVETYIEDGYALTLYLLEEFGQEKILLLGESWGSALGIFLAEKYPELYHAMIGTGQMVAFVETELLDYQMALTLAEKEGDGKTIKKLKENGPPPYYGKDVTWKSAAYLQYLSNIMATNPKIHNSGYNTLRDILSEEYGIWDKINYVRGIINTFNHVYPQLYPIDLREDYNKLDIPVYFLLGRHDINAPTSLVEDYYEVLEASKKEIVWFEHSGHSPWINESEAFVRELIRISTE